MASRVVITGSLLSVAEIQRRIEADISRAGNAFIQAADTELDRAFTEGPASGREYRSKRAAGHRSPALKYPRAFGNPTPEKGLMHTASAPGESPHEDTGNLRRSKRTDKSGLKGLKQTATVGWEGDEALIAAALDNGTRNGKIAPRPFTERAKRKGADAVAKELI